MEMPKENMNAGLKPAGIVRLQELRQENDALWARVVSLEDELEWERFLSGSGPEPATARMDAAISDPDPPDPKEEAEPSGPGERGRAPPPKAGKRLIPPPPKADRWQRIVKAAGNVLFYVALVLSLVGAMFIRAAQGGAPIRVAGYSGMLVLSGSMQDAIPQGSFILVRSVDPEELRVGDDITFMTNSTTSVTHRIIEILPQPDGSLSFRTQGVNNQTPDRLPVVQQNVVGKVVYQNLLLGVAAQSISDNWPLLLFLLGVWSAFAWVMVNILSQKDYRGRHLPETAQGKTGGGSPLAKKTRERR